MKTQKSFFAAATLMAVLFISFAFTKGEKVNMTEEGPSGTAYAVTWQNSAGYWFAVGPVQALWAGEKTEEKALDYVVGSKAKKAKKMKYEDTCGKFKVYDLGVDYESYDTDAIKYARKKGYDCSWP